MSWLKSLAIVNCFGFETVSKTRNTFRFWSFKIRIKVFQWRSWCMERMRLSLSANFLFIWFQVFFSGLNRSIEPADVKAILKKPSSYCPRSSIKYSRKKRKGEGAERCFYNKEKETEGCHCWMWPSYRSIHTYTRVTGGGSRKMIVFYNWCWGGEGGVELCKE